MDPTNLIDKFGDGQTAVASTSYQRDSDIESVAAIKRFIEEQEKEIQDLKNSAAITESKQLTETPTLEKCNDDSMDSKFSHSETISVASSMLDMIITESEIELAKKTELKSNIISPDNGNNSIALSVGSKVEVKDFAEYWHPAEIVEVDFDEMEVLVHYVIETKKHDEWINVSSPRLRPPGSAPVNSILNSLERLSPDLAPSLVTVKDEPNEEVKAEDKAKPVFLVGERILARWRDNRRFLATVRNVMEDGTHEIVFDDGCQWKCKTSRLYKLKPDTESLYSGNANSIDASTSQYGAGPGDAMNAYSTQNRHLFDPTRDYLGSKSERREKKRKLNIKEIFNIGQKRPKSQKLNAPPKTAAESKPRIIRKKDFKLKTKTAVRKESEPYNTAVNAVASIIGIVDQGSTSKVKQEHVLDGNKETTFINTKEETTANAKIEIPADAKVNKEKKSQAEVDLKDIDQLDNEAESADDGSTHGCIQETDKIQLDDLKPYLDPEVLEEETHLQQFEKPDEGVHEEFMDRIKEVINKLEDGLKGETQSVSSPKPEFKIEIPKVETPELNTETITPTLKDKPPSTGDRNKKIKDKLYRIKAKQVKMLRDIKVNKQVLRVRSELERMRKQMAEMRLQILKNQDSNMMKEGGAVMPESFLLPGEWCCKWVNGQPVGTVSEMECEMKFDPSGKPPLPRRSVQVEDKRLPPGWTKHMVRRSFGNSAGKWDIVLISPDNRRFHTKSEMRIYLENNSDKHLEEYEVGLTDFGAHLKLSRRMGWITNTPDGVATGPDNRLPVDTLCTTSPLVKRRKLKLNKKEMKIKNKIAKHGLKVKLPRHAIIQSDSSAVPTSMANIEGTTAAVDGNTESNAPKLEDGFVYVGSLKVQVIDNLLRCPAEGCLKNFRNNTLLQMHIKHYHRELKKMMGRTPKVLDLASARSMPSVSSTAPHKQKDDQRVIKVKLPRPPKPKLEDLKLEVNEKYGVERAITPVIDREVPRSQDSPKLRQALINKPIKRPRVLLPVRRVEPEQAIPDSMNEGLDIYSQELNCEADGLSIPNLDFEMAISTHTVTKPTLEKKRNNDKKKSFVLPPKALMSEEEDWFAMNSDVETRSSFPRSGTPDSKLESKTAPVSSDTNEDNKDSNNTYTYNENGERIKIVHMKREEIINCHCGFREEDGLMVQCELCLCWQHALCHNIQRETDVPEKYTCSICLNPRRGRRSMRFVHDQDRMYEGVLPGARAHEPLRRSHELTGNLLRIEDALHALRVKYYVATKKDHPKLYLWAKDWEHAEIQYTQEKLNSDYSDLNIIINNIGKENLPVKPDDVKDMPLDIRASPSDSEQDRFSQRELPLGHQTLLSGLLSSPGGASLDLSIPISTTELERLAKSVQEQENERALVAAPQPEAAIENGACRERLLKHLQRCQALIDARLDSIEAQVAELESQDPSFEDDETAEYFPRTKQTIQMLMRDLDTMEELGVIT